MKVYVIEKGCYSDRHIIGVVETEEEAKKICKAVSGHYKIDGASYTEYDTKQFTTSLLRYVVSDWYGVWRAEYDDYDLRSMYKTNMKEYDGSYIIYASDPEQAIKIAQDMKAEEDAKEAGIV